MKTWQKVTLAFFGIVVVAGIFAKPNQSSGTKDAGVEDHPVTAKQFANAEKAVGDAMKNPEKVMLMECFGVQVYQDPQPPGHPPTVQQCWDIFAKEHISKKMIPHDFLDRSAAAGVSPPPNYADSQNSAAPSGAQNAPVSTDQPDPYAARQQQFNQDDYHAQRAEFLDHAKTIFFAATCRSLLYPDLAGSMVQYEAGAFLLRTTGATSNVSDPDLDAMTTAAEEAGIKLAQQPSGCDYWKNHPEAVASIRREAELAHEP